MNRVWLVNHCQDCPANQPNWSDEDVWCDWCNKAKRKILPLDAVAPFPTWCPLPEKEEEAQRQDGVAKGLRAELAAAQNLLARIHRDGGHHTEAVGFTQSVADADAKVSQWLLAAMDGERYA